MRLPFPMPVPVRIQRTLAIIGIFLVLYLLCAIFSKYNFSYNTNEFTDEVCHHPKLDINDAEIMKFIKDQPPIDCGEKDWVEIDGSIARITDDAKNNHGNIECQFTEVTRSSDYSTFAGVTTVTHTEYNFESTDFIRVYCHNEKGKKWESRMAGIRVDDEIFEKTGWNKVPTNSLRLNVLMFGFDSLSRMAFMRKLPESYKKLISMGAIVLEGYNIIGDGTPQALIPILTGSTELELPDTRRRMGTRSTYVNVYPFIWNDYKKHGYVTAFMEDTPYVGIFTYRLKGFKEEPTDHYMRTYYLDAVEDFPNHRPYCMAGMPRHKVMMDYAKHVFSVYRTKPKFIFGFHGELSHDSNNLIGAVDYDLVEWLDWFNDRGHLNNTLLIFMSDHGARFVDVRNTQQGKLEERLPFFSFVLPPWFKDKYPGAYGNLKKNVHRLTTPFDIYATLHDVLQFEGDGVGSLRQRSISLFKEVPEKRTCLDANIESHWCACLTWEKIVDDEKIERISNEFVAFLNKYNAKYSKLCSILKLKSVEGAAKLLPNKNVLAFKNANDADGFIPDLSGKIQLSTEMYQLKIRTVPGNGLFEFSTTYHIKDDKFTFRITDVSRINKYGVDAACIENTQEQLRKYCHCKSTE